MSAAEADGYQVVPVALLGHKADLGLMALGPDIWRLRRFQTEVAAAGLVGRRVLRVADRGLRVRGRRPRRAAPGPPLPPAAARGQGGLLLLPDVQAAGRAGTTGTPWTSTPARSSCWATARSGRTFHGRVLQVITGSTGLDDYEWGVTLFGVHPDDLKECVYEMRFDEASARYAEFGPFYTGMVGPLDDVLAVAGRVSATP